MSRRTVVVMGVCSASTVAPGASALARTYGRPWGDAPAQRVAEQGGLLPLPRAADRAAVAAGLTRADVDAAAARSHSGREFASPAIFEVGARLEVPADELARALAAVAQDRVQPRRRVA